MIRKTFRYDWYGALFGLGLPLLSTVIEGLRQFQSLAPLALLRAHLGQPLLWIMDTTPLVLGLLGRIILTQQATVVRQSQELVEKSQALVAAEQARREGFESTARRLFHAAQGLLGTVSDFTNTTGAAAASVRRVTDALTGLSQTASAAALTADEVIGLTAQAERASAEGLRQVEATGAELPRLAEQVREMAASLRGSARAAREMARTAQRQEGEIEQVLKTMNEIAHATEATVASTRYVESEARALNDLAASLRESVKKD